MNDLQFIIEMGRRKAVTALNDIMIDTFEEIHEWQQKWKEETGEVPSDKGFCGLSAATLQKISELELEYVHEMAYGNERCRLYTEFLNLNSLRMKEFRATYPNAYTKWDAGTDARLLKERRSGASLEQLSHTFGRNINAIKIRLERLGAGDAETADAASRYSDRPDRPF